MNKLRAALLVLSLLAAPCSHAEFEKNERGVLVTIGSSKVEIAARSPKIFRLSFSMAGSPNPANSIFLDNAPTQVRWTVIQRENKVGIKTGEAALIMDEATGAWRLEDTKTQAILVEGTSPTAQKHPETGRDFLTLDVAISKKKPFQAYGCGSPVKRGNLLHIESDSHVKAGTAFIPYYWCNAGYSAFGVTENDNAPAKWKANEEKGTVSWTFPGKSADLYLTAAPDLRQAARNYAHLSGQSKVPPRWTFGYLQSRWGWEDKAYIDNTLKTFQEHRLPVDAFFFDFECYNTSSDYKLPPEGVPNFPDFAWNPALFPNPAADIAKYRGQGLRVIPIRKPRMGDAARLELMRKNGWGLVTGQNNENVKEKYYWQRDFNFEKPDARKWYGENQRQMIEDGVAGWWNDEGESSYTKFYYWNLAQAEALAQYKPNMRHWSLNRSFQPGMQRLGTATWTGDIPSTWFILQNTPNNFLNWSLAGMPYSTCDIGGFLIHAPDREARKDGSTPPELMIRWMQQGVFSPIMHTHSVKSMKPHFPWMCGPEAEEIMRKAMELRYRLVPYYYSLAHETYETGLPLMRPLVMEFPQDPKVADLVHQWMMGSGLMAAPVMNPGGKRKIYFPEAMVPFAGGAPTESGEEIQMTAALDEIPVYVRAGTLLPLGPVVQNTDQLPGGPLELRIYPGKNASFTLVEDDGVSYDYLKGVVRKTTFEWDEKARTLSWKQNGSYRGKDIFNALRVVLFDAAGKKERSVALDPAGKMSFR